MEYKVISIIIASVSFILMVVLSFTTDILRHNGPTSPYSFSRLQLLLWSIVICPVFVLYWGYVNNLKPEINSTALILLGISGGVTVSSSIINNIQLNAKKLSGDQSIKLKILNSSSGFWIDILTDDNQHLSIVRLQQLIFTFIYLAIYITNFFTNHFQYPDFETNAFILMGISTGTYVVGKSINI